MAIIIPSKNIYDISNPKVRDNIIKNANISTNFISPNNEYDVTVYNEDISNKSEQYTNYNQSNYASSFRHWSGAMGVNFAYVNSYGSWRKCKITIPRNLQTLSIIESIKNKEFNVSVFYEHTPVVNSLDLTLTNFATGTANVTIGELEYNYSNTKNTFTANEIRLPTNNFDADGKIVISATSPSSSMGNPASTYIKVDNYTNLSGEPLTETTNEFSFEIVFLKEYRITSYASFYDFDSVGETKKIDIPEDRYDALKIEITLKGNKKGISESFGNEPFGMTDNNPYSTEENELMQDSGTFKSITLSENIANNILREYQNGKETAEIVCQIGDYYKVEPVEKTRELSVYNTTNDNRFEKTDDYVIFTDPEAVEITKVIRVEGYPDADTPILSSYDFEIINKNQIRIHSSMFGADFYSGHIDYNALYEQSSITIGYDAERMTFSNGDTVVPMIRNPQGVDIPMSRNADGSAKEFEVCGVNVYYNGAVWQKLSLKEIGVQNG